MKRNVISLFIMLLPVILFSQIPNNGFENWTSMGNYNNPDDWATPNDLTSTVNTYTCAKGSPGNPGMYYIKLTSKSVSGMGLIPGIAVSGILNTTNMQASGGFSYSGRPLALEGKWQYMAFGNDQGYMSVLLSKWNNDVMARDTVSYTFYALPGMEMSWSAFSIPIEYQSELSPDSAMIVLSSSNANGAATAVNSYLYIDNLSFKESTVDIREVNTLQSIHVYPNPVKSVLNFDYPATQEMVTLNIIDSKGSIVMNKDDYRISANPMLDVSNLKPGLYSLIVKSNNGAASVNFLKD